MFSMLSIICFRCDMPVSCPTCISKNPVITLKIKGLCQISKLNRIYNVVWREDGNIMFLGINKLQIINSHYYSDNNFMTLIYQGYFCYIYQYSNLYGKF